MGTRISQQPPAQQVFGGKRLCKREEGNTGSDSALL